MHKSSTAFLMSLAQAIQSAEFSLHDGNLVTFVESLNK